MVYNKDLELRIDAILSTWENIDKKKMFGGVCYLHQGNMFSGIYTDYLILKLGEEQAQKALDLTFVKAFDITGRPMKGWVMVGHEGISCNDDLQKWLNTAKAYVKTLPAK